MTILLSAEMGRKVLFMFRTQLGLTPVMKDAMNYSLQVFPLRHILAFAQGSYADTLKTRSPLIMQKCPVESLG